MLGAIKRFGKFRKNGDFINSCFAHGQTERQDTWHAAGSPHIGNMEKMEALTAQQNEQEATYKDPYYEVIKKPEHNGRVRLYGVGVTKSILKKRGNNSKCVLPQAFLEGIEKDYVEKLHELNPGMKFVLPDSFGAKIYASTADGGPSIRADSSNQVENQANELNGQEALQNQDMED